VVFGRIALREVAPLGTSDKAALSNMASTARRLQLMKRLNITAMK